MSPGIVRLSKRNGLVIISVCLIPAAGLADGDVLEAKVSKQSELAMAQSDVVLLVLDSTVGVTPDDQQVVNHLRRSKVPVLLVANKVDDTSHEHLIWELMGLGLGDPFPVSALHGRGTGDLLDEVVRLMPEATRATRPQISKTTIPTCSRWRWSGAQTWASQRCSIGLIGEERAIVHDQARHDPRRHRHHRGNRQWSDPFHRHGGDASQSADSRRHRVLLFDSSPERRWTVLMLRY